MRSDDQSHGGPHSRSEVVLIGPQRAGKSTIARLLGPRLGVPVCSLDALRIGYYREIGYDEAVAQTIREREGFLGLYRHWKPFEIYAVERVLTEHRDCVFDFGAGHSVYDDEAQRARARQALAQFRNVVLVLPSPDPEESVRILRERIGPWAPQPGVPFFDFERYYVDHPLNHGLASIRVYTRDQTAAQACEAVLQQRR
ncbi:MAG: shikimate kinase [Dehalococcoidia bacterium]